MSKASKKVVLAVWSDAFYSNCTQTIFNFNGLGSGSISGSFAIESEAWDDAASRLPQPIPSPVATESAGVLLIQQERRRQIESEGFDAEHDDEHEGGFMPAAASAYVLLSCDLLDGDYREADFTKLAKKRMDTAWPWDEEWWKPSPDPIRNLVKAGALIAAEIDRLHRIVPPYVAPLPVSPDSTKEKK